MTVEEIKDRISVTEILERFDVPVNRHKMVHCPFHGDDSHPSMKVYAKSVHCFTCGFDGDIFDIYMRFEHCDFKAAYKALGGGYETNMDKVSRELRSDAYAREKAEKKAKKEAEHKFFILLRQAIEMCRLADQACEVFSNDWKYLVDHRDWLEYVYDLKYIEGQEVNEIDVVRVCREVRRIFFAVG